VGRHHIRYAILPHTGPVSETTVRTAFNFNNPIRLLSRESSSQPSPSSPSSLAYKSPIRLTGSPFLILDCIKRGEDDADIQRGELPGAVRQGKSVIVRIYDSLGGEARGTIEIGKAWDVKRVWKCNILEDDEEEMKIVDGEKRGKKVELVLRAFEVATYRLQL
jgi:alpha-mannosidase